MTTSPHRSSFAASMGDWADGTRTLLVSPPDTVRQLSRQIGHQPGRLVVASTMEEAFRAMCAERLAAIVLALPLSGEAMVAAVNEMRVLRQGPALVVVGDTADRDAALAAGATAFLARTDVGAGNLRRALGAGSGVNERVSRLVEHVLHQRRIVDSLLEGVVITAPSGRVLYVNERATEILGIDQEELLYRPFPAERLQLSDENGRPMPKHEMAIHRALRTGLPVESMSQRLRRPDGSLRWVEVFASLLSRRPGAEPYAVAACFRDVTDERRSQAERRYAEERLRLGFEQGMAGMTISDVDGRIVEANPAFCDLLGEPAERVLGTLINDWVHEDDRKERLTMRQRLLAGDLDRYRAERRYVRNDGTVVPCLLNVSLIHDDGHGARYFFSQYQDITERKSHEETLRHRVHHDELTGLPNRLGLKVHLDDALRRAAGSGRRVAVLFLDVDRFKVVNDGLGHAAGDVILVAIARRLAASVREGDTVARFGGDEFIVVCQDVANLEEAGSLAQRTTRLFEAPFELDGKPLFVSASCGVVLVDATATAEDALRDADTAMYEAKARGQKSSVFDDQLRRTVSARLETEQALRLGLDRGELRVVYQPIISLADQRMVGVEALVRWDHPERGTLSPAEFIPAAEESGLIVGVGEHVLREALDQVSRWRASLESCSDLWVAVNVSPRQLSFGNPVATCARALAECGAAPDALRLELTETTLMADVDASVRILEDLRELGVEVAIDDFGTGYSSLAYLSRLPVSTLKIDSSFIAGIGNDPHAPEIVRTISSLARVMHLTTCAEGVERADQLTFVSRLGCELAQGFHWARPLRPSELEAFVESRRYVAAG